MAKPDEATRPTADPANGSGAPLTPDDEQSLLAAAAAGRAVTWWAERVPDRLAVVSDHRQCTFAALDGAPTSSRGPCAGAA
jgi:hypothetical protein